MLRMAGRQRKRQARLCMGWPIRTCDMRKRYSAIVGRPSDTAVDNGEIQFYRAICQFQHSSEKGPSAEDNDGFQCKREQFGVARRHADTDVYRRRQPTEYFRWVYTAVLILKRRRRHGRRKAYKSGAGESYFEARRGREHRRKRPFRLVPYA